jgi:hypothetical protein
LDGDDDYIGHVLMEVFGHVWIWQVKLCQIVGDELFFTWHIFLEVDKAQDFPSKIWQTLGDALIRVSFDVISS